MPYKTFHIAVVVFLFMLVSLLRPVSIVQAQTSPTNHVLTADQVHIHEQTLDRLQSQLQVLLQNQKKVTTQKSVVATNTQALASVSTTTAYDIIIVAGQSNAVGIGHGTYTELPRFTKASNTAKVFQLGRFADHDMKIIPVTHEPLEFWNQEQTFETVTNGNRGASYPFALRLAATELTGRKVLIIPAAKGGTSILEWDKVITNFGSSTPADTTILYDDMVSRVKFVLAQNPQNRVVGVIWRQGEADTNALYQMNNQFHPFITASIYQSKLETLRTRLRRDLANQGCFPFMFGEMTKQWVPDTVKKQTMNGLVAKEIITTAIKNVAGNDTVCNKSVFVSSSGTTANVIGTVHFDAPGQWNMAKKFWSAFVKLQP